MRMLRDDEYLQLLDIHHIIGDGSTEGAPGRHRSCPTRAQGLTLETITMASGPAKNKDEQRKTPQFEADIQQWYAQNSTGDCYSTLFLTALDSCEDADGLEALMRQII